MRLRDLLFQIGLVLVAIVLGRILDFEIGYVIAAVLAMGLITQWVMQKEEGQEEFEGNSLFGGIITDDTMQAGAKSPPTGVSGPCVIATEYRESMLDAGYGVSISNDGDAIAYDITIHDVKFGTSKLVFHGSGVPRLAKSDGKKFYEAWIEQDTGGLLLGGLFHEMVRLKVAEIEISITYKDHANMQYETRCKIERDVMATGGLVIRYVSQLAPHGVKSLPQSIADQCFPPPPRKPNVQFVAYQFPALSHDHDTGIWHEYNDIHAPIYKACVLHFTNDLHQDGKGVAATYVRAQIIWKYVHEAPGPLFSPAPWVGELYGQIDFPVGVVKKVIVAVKSVAGEYWDGYSNSRLQSGEAVKCHSDMIPFDGTMVLKLIDSTDECIYEGKWGWTEDIHTHWPNFRQLS